jgi:hypothetical protein
VSASVSRYPLAWPVGWPRKNKHGWSARVASFKVTFEKALAELDDEIERLGARYPILSTNLEVRLDGTLRRNREPEDRGVAVYSTSRANRKCSPAIPFRLSRTTSGLSA